jgi:hypothetical protein
MTALRIALKFLLMITIVVASEYCEAATPITISTVSPGVYSISAADLPDSSGIDLSLTYNSAFLKDPVVSAGSLTPSSSVMMVPNTATPGFIRIAIITGYSIKGTGVLAKISFTKIADSPPQPVLATPSVISVNGELIAAQSIAADSSQISNNDKKDNNSSLGTSGSTVTASSSAVIGTSTSIGTVSLPQETIARNDFAIDNKRKDEPKEDLSYQNNVSNPAPVATVAVAPVSPPVSVDAKSAALPGVKSSPSVMERFRSYNGPRTIKRLATLFDEKVPGTIEFTQTPSIAVSDGKSLITIILTLASESDAPSFSLKGANLKSIKRLTDKKWQLEALPQKGKSDVRLSVILKGERIEIPLVAVPPLHKAGSDLLALSNANVDALLAKPFKNGKPAYDLNADGVQDYIDDYILVAHLLLKQQRSAGKSKVDTGK